MPRFDRFDIAIAWYFYAMHYHNGQFSELYKVFGRLAKAGFKIHIASSWEEFSANPECENVKAIYDSLVERKVYQ